MYFILSLIPLFVLTFFKSKKSMHMLQQNYYDESKRYFLWMTKNLKKVFLTVDIFLLVSIICLFINETVSYIFFASLSFFLTIIYHSKKEQVKKPLVVTARIKRLFTTLSIVYIIILTIVMLNYNKNYSDASKFIDNTFYQRNHHLQLHLRFRIHNFSELNLIKLLLNFYNNYW